MKLDKTLNFKKVRCVKGYDGCLKIGREYNVIDVSVEIKVKDDEGEFLYWESDHFEPVLEPAENPLQNIESTTAFETTALEPKFKVGDKVYVGLTGKIAQVTEIIDDEVVNVVNKNNEVRAWISNICHATQENYERLQATFPHIEFEQPPKPLSGDGLVTAMLAKGIKNVLCLWTNGDKIVIDGLDYKGALVDINNNIVSGLTPIDWCTGEPLTQAVLDDDCPFSALNGQLAHLI